MADYPIKMNYLQKKTIIIKAIIFSLILGVSTPSYSEVDPKITALGTMAVYGTVGGFLLGVASLAFGTSGRAVAQGSSLGLYAGLLFGGYVVGSHAMGKRRKGMEQEGEDYYPDTQESPYESYFFKESELKQKYADLIKESASKSIAQVSSTKTINFLEKKPESSYYIQFLNIQF